MKAAVETHIQSLHLIMFGAALFYWPKSIGKSFKRLWHRSSVLEHMMHHMNVS